MSSLGKLEFNWNVPCIKPWLDSVDVCHSTQNNSTTDTSEGYTEIHNVHKSESHKVFTRFQMLPINSMGKTTDNKGLGYHNQQHFAGFMHQ